MSDILSPCKIGLSRLLKCCDDYAVSHDIVYNGSKSCVLIWSPNKTVSRPTDPVFCIQNNLIVKKPKTRYLGHIINEDMSDDADVFRQVKCLYIRGNIVSMKFANCSINVKLVVFKTYCSCLYTSQLWGTCLSRTMNRFKVAYNDSLRMVLGIPRYFSASEIFAYTNVPSCQCVTHTSSYTVS